MTTEIDRFYSDLRADSKMQKEASDVWDLEQLAAFAKSRGYDMKVDELKQYDAENSELSVEELDAVAGGFAFVTSSIIVN